MAIQSNMNLMGVNYSDANALWKQAVDQLANAGEKTRKQVNINQEKFDSNVLGFVNQLANKHGVDTPEFEQGMQQILAQNPNNNLDMGTILANAMQSRGTNLGLQKAGLENQITQGGIDDAQIINSIAPLIAKRDRTPEEEALVQQGYGKLKVSNMLEPTLKVRQMDDTFKVGALNALSPFYGVGRDAGGVLYNDPTSAYSGVQVTLDNLADPSLLGVGPGGGYGGTGGGTGGLFPSAPTAQTQTSGNAGGARVPDAYARYVNQASKKYGVHSTLIAAVMKAESSFNPIAGSSKGAQGLMQLMPGTAKEMGVSNPWDPGQNIEGGTKYLSNMLKKYNGNVGHALMAYNWGPGNVDNYLAGKARPPKETLDYVRKVTANLREGTAATLAARSGGTSTASTTPPSLDKVVTSKTILGNQNTKALASRSYELIQSMSQYMDSKGQFITKHKDKYAPLAKEYADIKSSMKTQLGKNFGEWEKSTKNMWKAVQKANTPVAKNTTTTNTGFSNQNVNSPFKVSQWDAQVSGKALQSRLKIKQNESVANGSVLAPTAEFAEIIQGQLGNNLKYFSAFNDTYHAGSNSRHAKGTAFDLVLKDGVTKQQAASTAQGIQQLAAQAGYQVKVLDEYNNPSKNSTGGHLHITVVGKTGANGRPTTMEGFMGGMSIDDALGLLGKPMERPGNLPVDDRPFQMALDFLGFSRDDPLMKMAEQLTGWGAERGELIANRKQQNMDYRQYMSDYQNTVNAYANKFTQNKIKVDTQIQKELQDQAKLNQVRNFFSGGLVGTLGESRAKEFVDYIKSYRELSKEEFYAASPEEQFTLLKDWAQQQMGFDSQSAKSENKRGREGALLFNDVALQADKVLDKMAASRAGTDPSVGDFKDERTKVKTASTALKNVLKDIKDSKDRELYDSIDSSITPKALETILSESIEEYEASALGTRADMGTLQTLFSGKVGFKGNGTLTDEEFKKLQSIVRAKLIKTAKDYDKQLAAALIDSRDGQQAGSDLKGILDLLSQIKSNI